MNAAPEHAELQAPAGASSTAETIAVWGDFAWSCPDVLVGELMKRSKGRATARVWEGVTAEGVKVYVKRRTNLGVKLVCIMRGKEQMCQLPEAKFPKPEEAEEAAKAPSQPVS